MHVEEKESRPPLTPTFPISEPLTYADDTKSLQLSPEEADEIFVKAVSEIPTQPLPKLTTREETHALILLYVCVLSFIVGSLLAFLTYPTVTITLVPVHQSVIITTPITIATHSLSPVTLTRTLTALTTGKGHTDATQARGTLTFYNAAFTTQTIDAGSVFTGSDRVEVITDETVALPPDNPPVNGEASVSAHAINPGSQGNLPALDINRTVSSSLFVKNLTAFTGGEDARDFHTVAQRDLDSLTTQLQQQLTKAIPQAFRVSEGEEVTPTNCTFTAHADHAAGDEAQTVTVNASKTCGAITYDEAELEQKAIVAFNATRPATLYERVGMLQTTVISLSPLAVRLSGIWEYRFTQDDEQYLAQHIQEETPAQARAYLFKTGKVSRVTMTQTQTLPDYYHIKFLILMGV